MSGEPTSQRLRHDYRRGDQPEHEWFNQAANWLNNIEGLDGVEVSYNAGRIYISFVATPDIDETGTFGTIGDADEGDEAADSGEWAVDGDTGLYLDAMTRVGFFDAGDETLYGYVRRLKFDSQGRLFSVGGETRITIDLPGTCS